MFGILPMLAQIQSENPSSSSASSSKKSGQKNHSISLTASSPSQKILHRNQRCNRTARAVHQSTRAKTSGQTYHEQNIDVHFGDFADQLGCCDLVVRVFPGKGHSFPLRCRCTSSSCLSCVPAETRKTPAVHQLTIQTIQKDGYHATFTCNHEGRRCAFCKRTGFASDSVRVQIRQPADDSDDSDVPSDTDESVSPRDYWRSPDLPSHTARQKEHREAKSCPHGRRRCRQCTKETHHKGSVKRSHDLKSATFQKITQTLDPTTDDDDDFPDDRPWTKQDHFMATQGDDLIIRHPEDIPWDDKLCSETIPQDIEFNGSEWIVRT